MRTGKRLRNTVHIHFLAMLILGMTKGVIVLGILNKKGITLDRWNNGPNSVHKCSTTLLRTRKSILFLLRKR